MYGVTGSLAGVLSTNQPLVGMGGLEFTFLHEHNPKLDLNPQRLQKWLQ